MNKEQKNFESKQVTVKSGQNDKPNKDLVKATSSRIQTLSEKLFLLGERSPNYVLGYN